MTKSPIVNDTLPGWLRVWFTALAEAPWTNIRTANGLLLLNGTALYAAVATIRDIPIAEGLFNSWLIFLGAVLGVGVLGHIGKRATYQPSPPTPPDVEDASAVHGTPELAAPTHTDERGDL